MTLQTCVPENFRYCRWGAERRVSRAQTRERGPPSELAEIFSLFPSFWQELTSFIKLLISGRLVTKTKRWQGPCLTYRGWNKGLAKVAAKYTLVLGIGTPGGLSVN